MSVCQICVGICLNLLLVGNGKLLWITVATENMWQNGIFPSSKNRVTPYLRHIFWSFKEYIKTSFVNIFCAGFLVSYRNLPYVRKVYTVVLFLKCHLYCSFISIVWLRRRVIWGRSFLKRTPRKSCDWLKVNICRKNEKYLFTGAWRAPWNLVGFKCVGILRRLSLHK